MCPSLQWLTEFQVICQDLQQDVLLLEALTLHAEQKGTGNPVFFAAFHRALDYLSQHADDLRFLSSRLTPPVPPAAR